MKINIAEIIGKEAVAALQSNLLHKVAAESLRAQGLDVGNEMDLRGAVAAIGAQAFLKNAEANTIAEGLVALREIERGE